MSAVINEGHQGDTTKDPSSQLVERLSQPDTVATLNRLLDHLDTFAFLMESIDGFLSRGEVVLDSVSEGVAELRRFDGGEVGVEDLAGRLPEMAKTGTQLAGLAERSDLDAVAESGIVEKLTDPRTLRIVSDMLDRLEVAGFALDSLDGFLRRGEVVTDSLAEGISEIKQIKPDPAGRDFVTMFTDELPKMTQAAAEMMDSGMLDPKVIGALGEIGSVMADAHHEAKANPPAPVGLIGAMRAMRDPNVQVAVGMGLHVAKRLGEHLSKQSQQQQG